MDATKREELEKTCNKIYKVRTRTATVRTVRVLGTTDMRWHGTPSMDANLCGFALIVWYFQVPRV